MMTKSCGDVTFFCFLFTCSLLDSRCSSQTNVSGIRKISFYFQPWTSRSYSNQNVILYFFEYSIDSFFFVHSTSIDGERTQQQQPINDIFVSNSSSFIRNLSDTKRSEPYVLCQIFSDGQSLCMPVQTSFKSFTDKWK